ncbi:MAG TPA: O-antigen ligase domain-containing protein [Bacteroides sp.]|nr:O-antigen ligase domain-containing protein [Bacteroides sp.]
MIAWPLERYPRPLFWGIILSFIALNAVMLAFEIYYVPLIPALLLFVALAIISIDKYLLAIVFFVPLSIPLSTLVKGLSIDMFLPTEPLLAGLLLLYLLKYLMGARIDLRVLRHPVTLAVYFHLAWMLVTSITSSDPVVSFKMLASRLWFIVGFYLVASQVFRKERSMHTYVWLFIIAFAGVIVYTLINHAGYGLNNQMMAHSVSKPFYKDHTSYGATLGLILPVLVALFLLIKRENTNTRFLMVLLIILFIFALIFSYTRAAWISIIGSLVIWAIIKLRVRFEIVLAGAVVLVGFFLSIRSQIMVELEKNRVESSSEFSEHIQSMSNISTDQSNLERINRWSCAYRMWRDKPIFGFGPGTYQFEYGRYQRSYEKTRISTDFGTMGNAHSEYLGPLSESGILGLVGILLVIGTTIYTGLRVYFTSKRRSVRIFSLAVLVGLFSYYLHGVLNNFLDTDKLSVLFWGYTSMLVAMDVYHRESPEEEDAVAQKENKA